MRPSKASVNAVGVIPMAPRRMPVIGHTLALLRDPFGFVESLALSGDLVWIQAGRLKMLVVCDPDVAHDVLMNDRVFDKGGFLFDRARDVVGNGLITCAHADHRRQRRLAQPAFHSSRLVTYSPKMTEQIAAVLGTWHDGQVIDAQIEMQKITAAVMLSTMFGTSMSPKMIAEVMDDLTAVLSGIYLRMFLPGSLGNLPLPTIRRFYQANTRLRRAITSVISNRIQEDASEMERHDLLTMLLRATDEDARGEGFSKAEVADQLITFFSAGVETTANTLVWALCLISRAPTIQERLHAEVDAVLAGRAATYDDLPSLPLTQNIIKETLRLQPAVWFMTRQVTTDTNLAGHAIPAGTTLVYSPYLIHHHPDFYLEPGTFNPDRWNVKTPTTPSTSRERNSFIPFGGGARKCIGDELGTTEAVLALASIAGRWQVRSMASSRPESHPGATNRPKTSRLRLAARAPRPAPVADNSGAP
jgi:cytochrome P450